MMELETILRSIQNNAFFSHLDLFEDSVLTGSTSELKSIYLIQLIGFLEDEWFTDVDILGVISDSEDDYTLGRLIRHLITR